MSDTPKRRGGRPPLDSTGRPTTLIGVRLTDEAYFAAAKAARTRHESIQDLMRRALRRELTQSSPR